jgi:hypothetical protein
VRYRQESLIIVVDIDIVVDVVVEVDGEDELPAVIVVDVDPSSASGQRNSRIQKDQRTLVERDVTLIISTP